MSYIETYSGKKIDFFEPRADQIDIADIARGLSRLPRFAGQTKTFYSVALHSVNVAGILPEKYKLQGLMHDAAEAYIGDLPTPFKRNIPEFAELEKRIWTAICERFGIALELAPLVKTADATMLVSERDLLKPAVTDWGAYEENLRVYVQHRSSEPDYGFKLFLEEFQRLTE